MTNKREEKGAEATVEIKENEVIKERKSKNYRHTDLDQRIREKRTQKEANIIKKAAKYEISPSVLEEKDFKLKIEKVEGKTLKKQESISEKSLIDLGKKIALMHENDIIHGDLNTKNIIEKEEGHVKIIDYGLSEHSDRLEDKAVDLHLLKQVLKTSHTKNYPDNWKKFKQGYKNNYKNHGEIFDQLEEVESRGRYK